MSIKTATAYIDADTKTIRDAIDRKQARRPPGPQGGRWSIATEDLLTWRTYFSRDVRDDG